MNGRKPMQKPYVITDDLALMVRQFEQDGLKIPSNNFLQSMQRQMTEALSCIYNRVDIVPSSDIEGFVTETAKQSPYPVVTLASAFKDPLFDRSLQLSRGSKLSNGQYSDIGLIPRTMNDPSVQDQFNSFADKLKGQDIALADDVIFSGGTISTIIDNLDTSGVRVKQAIASVIINGGYETLQERGVSVQYERIYDDVIDEVCMRDFIAGIPDGGRNVIDGSTRKSAPYIWPFGDAEKWASLPPSSLSAFSKVALEISCDFWEEMDRLNGCKIGTEVLSKPIVAWPETASISDGVKAVLKGGRYAAFNAN